MKTGSPFRNLYLPVLAILGLTLSACMYVNRINGSGNVTKAEHSVAGFNKLDIGIVFNAVIIPSQETKVVVELDDNLQQYVKINQSDSTLSIQMENGINIGKSSGGKIYIYEKGIREITNSSVGRLSNEGELTAATFRLTNSSVGNNDFRIKADTITIDNSSVGRTNLFLESRNLIFTNSSVGKTILAGYSTEARIDNSGVGSFDAKNLMTQVMHINNSAVGSTQITADKEFYIDNSGVGGLDTYGKGTYVKLDDSGITKTHKH